MTTLQSITAELHKLSNPKKITSMTHFGSKSNGEILGIEFALPH